MAKYMRPHGETHWSELAYRVVSNPMAALEEVAGRRYQCETSSLFDLLRRRWFMPGGRYLYAAGNDFHQTQNCLLLRCEDTREGWADLSWKAEMSLLTGAGIGVYYGDVRHKGAPVGRTGGTASGPIPKAVAVNELGRAAVQGGDRRSAIWGGLLWSHPDIFDWITAKDWSDYIKAAKESDPSIPAALDMTNISVCLDDEFFRAFEGRAVMVNGQDTAPVGTWQDWAQKVYWATVDHMTQTGEPGFSVDLGDKRDEKLRNACTEIVSADDSDICNLGGLVLPRFDSPAEFGRAVRVATLFLTAGSVYSDLPYDKVDEVRTKNRRLGLDLLGIHEFCLRRGVAYGSDDAKELLEPYMAEYRRSTEWAHQWQDEASLSLSVATRAGSPTGTRGIVAETTTSWEPVTYAAYARDVITSKAHERDERTTHYVVDPTVARLLREGVLKPTDDIEDSASLATDYERRFDFQAFAQEHIDHAVSMTINLPHVMTELPERRAFGNTLIKYLPKLRGITVYPNGAIAGQPIRRADLTEALDGSKILVQESEDKCASGVCGL
jgi:ribonucleoside-diphosphate reductase alpha chain